MQTYIALLRGINVGGHKKLKMADLKLLFEGLGFHDVVTYIQSGNVVFSTWEGTNISEKISKEITKKFSWEVPVLVKTADEVAKILKDCPFSETKKAEAYFVLLASQPETIFMKAVCEISCPKEEFVLTPDCVYIYYSQGHGNEKLNNNFFEKKLKVTATTRNYRTLAKLVELAG